MFCFFIQHTHKYVTGTKKLSIFMCKHLGGMHNWIESHVGKICRLTYKNTCRGVKSAEGQALTRPYRKCVKVAYLGNNRFRKLRVISCGEHTQRRQSIIFEHIWKWQNMRAIVMRQVGIWAKSWNVRQYELFGVTTLESSQPSTTPMDEWMNTPHKIEFTIELLIGLYVSVAFKIQD